MCPAAFGLVTVIAILYFVMGALLLSVYEDKVMESESRVIRILTRLSIIFAWPVWFVVMMIALICVGITESFKALFK